MINSTSEEREALRRQRALEREAKARRREEANRRSNEVKASSKIPAKWYPRGGKAVTLGDRETGERVRIEGGMFYAGSNMAGMVAPGTREPSLVDPTQLIKFSHERVPRTGKFLGYASITPEQRGEYVRFLASDRSKCDDIGYPFIYLYGLERRLLVDARKEGEVSREERLAISREVLRLLLCFRRQSESFAMYAAMLLLYDGAAFEGGRMTPEQFSSVFLGKAMPRKSKWNDDVEAYEYMVLARAAQLGLAFPEDDLLAYCRLRAFRGNGEFAYSPQDLYSPDGRAALKLMCSRYRNSSAYGEWPGADDSPTRLSVGKRDLPAYHPASPSIRKAAMHPLGAAITDLRRTLPDLEGMQAPFKELSDLSYQSMTDVARYRALLGNKTPKGLEDVPLDAVFFVTTPRRLYAELKGSRPVTEIPHDLLASEMEALLGHVPEATQKGVLSAQTQVAYQALAASVGWQVILPCSLPQPVGKLLRVRLDDNIVAFHRGVRYRAKGNGRQVLSPVFTGSDVNPGFSDCPEAWVRPMRVALVLAWLMGKAGKADMTLAEFGRVARSLDMPPLGRRGSQARRYRLMLMYSAMLAMLRYEQTPAALRECLREVPFASVKRAVFTWCQAEYGRMLPRDVLAAIEVIYERSDHDKSVVLYDYHAGSYGDTSPEEADEFSIDDDRLRSTIRDTSGVHDILNDALGPGDGDDDLSEETDVDMGDADDDARDDGEPDGEGPDDGEADGGGGTPAEVAAFIRGLYDEAGTDEMATTALQAAIVERFGVATSAQALTLVSEANAWAEASDGEAIVEIDGPDAYLN